MHATTLALPIRRVSLDMLPTVFSIRMDNINTGVIIKALLVSVVLEEILRTVGIPLFSDSLTVEAIRALRKHTPFLLYELAAVFFAAVLGGYICGRYEKFAPYKNTTLFASVSIFYGLVAAYFDPLWFDLTIVLAILSAAYLGARIAVIQDVK